MNGLSGREHEAMFSHSNQAFFERPVWPETAAISQRQHWQIFEPPNGLRVAENNGPIHAALVAVFEQPAWPGTGLDQALL